MKRLFITLFVLTAAVSFLTVSGLAAAPEKAKAAFKYDDALDVFGVHGVGGMWGTIATGLFAEKVVNEAGGNGLLFGDVHQFLVQVLLIVVAPVFAGIMTWIIFKFVDALVGMRVEKKDEIIGLDLTQQSEAAYTVVE